MMNRLITNSIVFTTAKVVQFMWLGKVTGIDNIPQRPSIIIANHASYVDFLLIGYSLAKIVRIPFQFWAKTKVINHSLWKIYAEIFSAIEVRNNSCMDYLLKLSREALKQGSYICIFPEGTRTRTGELMPFKQGYLKLATALGVEIVPVYLENTFCAWPSFRRFPRRRKCNITFYPPIKIAKDIKKSDIEIINRTIMQKYSEYTCCQPCG